MTAVSGRTGGTGSARGRFVRIARPGSPPSLEDRDAVRAHLARSVRNYEIRDLAVPIVANAFVLGWLFWAWGVTYHWSSVGDSFLVPCIVSAVGLVVAQVALGAWWFNRHRWGARVVVAEEDAVVTRADMVVVSVHRKGAPVRLGPPSLVRVGARLPGGETLAWTVQAAAWRDGVGAARSVGPVALLGAPVPGRWLLGIDANGEILWPTTPAAQLVATPQA